MLSVSSFRSRRARPRLRGADAPPRAGGALRPLPTVVLCVLTPLAAFGGPGRVGAEPATEARDVIIVLKDGVDPATVARDAGISPRRVFRSAIRGFAVRLPGPAIEALRRNRHVKLVTDDRPMRGDAQELPVGIDRVNADRNRTAAIDGRVGPVNVDVAVLDTGIDRNHPDLNVVGGKDCTSVGSYADDHGHGTHISGTIGALDNGSGVVGMAPGARLWAVKVLDRFNGGSWSAVMCGLDWVAANRATIDVVNMSIGGAGSDGPCETNPLHEAICNVVAQGIAVVVSAGNASTDASSSVPATYDEVITVSAIADYDGRPGALSRPNCGTRDRDDALASFSNHGRDVDIAAPGRCVVSTARGGGLASWSGTSMAAPHVTGAAALYLADNPWANPDQVRNWLLNAASAPQGSAFGFSGDRDGYAEPLLTVGGVQDPDPGEAATADPIPEPAPRPTVEEATGRATVIRSNGQLGYCRAEPSADGSVLAIMMAGTRVRLYGKPTGEWQPVGCRGRVAYMLRASLEIIQPARADANADAAGSSDARAQPDDESGREEERRSDANRGGPAKGEAAPTSPEEPES